MKKVSCCKNALQKSKIFSLRSFSKNQKMICFLIFLILNFFTYISSWGIPILDFINNYIVKNFCNKRHAVESILKSTKHTKEKGPITPILLSYLCMVSTSSLSSIWRNQFTMWLMLEMWIISGRQRNRSKITLVLRRDESLKCLVYSYSRKSC